MWRWGSHSRAHTDIEQHRAKVSSEWPPSLLFGHFKASLGLIDHTQAAWAYFRQTVATNIMIFPLVLVFSTQPGSTISSSEWKDLGEVAHSRGRWALSETHQNRMDSLREQSQWAACPNVSACFPSEAQRKQTENWVEACTPTEALEHALCWSLQTRAQDAFFLQFLYLLHSLVKVFGGLCGHSVRRQHHR